LANINCDDTKRYVFTLVPKRGSLFYICVLPLTLSSKYGADSLSATCLTVCYLSLLRWFHRLCIPPPPQKQKPLIVVIPTPTPTHLFNTYTSTYPHTLLLSTSTG
jgi:hypothetical protein